MQFLDILTILCTGPMVGTEFTVSAFINPVVRQLDDRTQAKIFGLFGTLLGKAMPFWYSLCLVLLLADLYLRRHTSAWPSLAIAAAIWVALILYSIFLLVPINNRIVALDPAARPAGWMREHQRWETLHRWRIVFLVVAFVFLLHGILG
jgi:hypothetical protein